MKSPCLMAAAAMTAFTISSGSARAADPLAASRLRIAGSRLTLYADAQAGDAEQLVAAGEQARVRTCYGAIDAPCGSVPPGDPRIAGLDVVADLSGPELTHAVELRTPPGGVFVLPSFQQPGDYRLANIRLVNMNGTILGWCEPPAAVLHVDQVLLTSATVTRMTLAELQQRGLHLSQDSYQAFNFAVGFAFRGEQVIFNLPVLFQSGSEATPLAEPEVDLDALPEGLAPFVERWQPPTIVPFALETATCDPEREERCREQEVENTPPSFPLFGAIVIPGTVSFLHQFFDAQLIVANGAPEGLDADLTNLKATLKLPGGGVLRLARTEPPVAPGQQVPLVGEEGAQVIPPTKQAAASWAVEGLKAGTHALQWDLTGELLRQGRPPLPLATRAQGLVEVVDARFHLSFSHPEVVREGEAYSLFVTITNLSRASIESITLALDEGHLEGTSKANPDDTLQRSLPALGPGEAETLEFGLISQQTGKCFATTLEADPGITGSIHLRTGVGELGIPLSPATLVLPRHTERLGSAFGGSDELLRANLRLLGLAYSLATAPAGMAPAGLPALTTPVVERRAWDLAEAGRRTLLHDGLLESLEVLALEQLGNRHPLAGFDELRRETGKGGAAADSLAELLRQQQAVRGLDAIELLDHLAATTSYAAPYLAAAVAPVTGEPAPTLTVRRLEETGTLCLGNGGCGVFGGRSLPFGEVYSVSAYPGSSQTAPLALVGRVRPDEQFDVYLHNDSAVAALGRLVLVVPDGATGEFRRLDFGEIAVPPYSAIGVTAGASVPDPGEGFTLFWQASNAPVDGAVPPALRSVDLPPFTIIGAVQDFQIAAHDAHGTAVAYLFNRPPREDVALHASAFSVRSTFNGLDVHGQPVQREATKVGEAAFLQDDERVLLVRYSGPISPFRADDGSPLIEHEHEISPQGVEDRFGHALSSPIPDIETEATPLHVGGLVAGRVIRGSGAAAAGATVELLRARRDSGGFGRTVLDVVERVVTDAEGEFYFDCVEMPHWRTTVEDSFTLRATVPPGTDRVTEPAAVGEITSVIRQQGRLATMNIALLGRGTVIGRLLWADDHAPVAGGTVVTASTLFREMKSVAVEADGSFSVPGVPVGPITLTGRAEDGNAVYATVGIAAPGAVVDVLLELPRAARPLEAGTVLGTIMRRTGDGNESPTPAVGATVAVYAGGHPIATVEADSAGRFRFGDVPAGQVTIQAADWRISRSSVLLDLLLGEGETRIVELTLRESAPRSIVGVVYYHDPVLASLVPVAGAPVFIPGPGVVTHTAADGSYRLEGVPVQGLTDAAYEVTAIDYTRQLQGSTSLQVLDASPAEIPAAAIVLEPQVGGLDGIVLDPLGRPYDGAQVVLFPIAIKSTSGGGRFSVNNVPIGAIGDAGEPRLLVHVGDGLQEGKVGYFGSAATQVVYGGHRPFVTVRMRGSGVVRVRTTNQTGDDIQSLVYVRPTVYVEAEKAIRARPEFIAVESDDQHVYQIEIPVGQFQVIAYNPFHGERAFNGEITYPGQVLEYDVTFAQAGTLEGTVLDVDGLTPVPRASVTLLTDAFTPRTVQADDLGHYSFELVPPGGVMVTATAAPGGIDRVGAALGAIAVPGQVLDLPIRLKAKGTVRGRVVQRTATGVLPVPYAHVAVQEYAYPNRRLPATGSFVLAGPDGRYQVPGVFAGAVGVVAHDPAEVERTGSASGAITADWQIVELPDVVLSTDVGTLTVTVRRSDTAEVVPDCQVTLGSGEATVTDATGVAVFEALPLGSHSVYAFHAPSGRGGRLGGLQLTAAGQHLAATVDLNQTGAVHGTLFDDAARTEPVSGATVELRGSTTVGELRALATTDGTSANAGRFRFDGIPEGQFSLTAAAAESPRRAATDVELTALSPIADVALVLEATGGVYVQVREKLSTSPQPGHSEVDAGAVSLSVTLEQDGYRFTGITPESTPSGHVFAFPNVLLERRLTITAREVDGEQRLGRIEVGPGGGPGSAEGHGTIADPYWLVLGPRGAVRVTVRDAQGALVPGATVTLTWPDGGVASRSTGIAGNELGIAVFDAVAAGTITASASLPGTTLGGAASGVLVFDDQLVDLAVTFAPTVAVVGTVRQPAPDDAYVGDGSELPPQAGAAVEITDAAGVRQSAITADDGSYRFVAVAPGPCVVKAWQPSADGFAQSSATVVGPDGNENVLAPLVLDAAPPRIVAIAPAPGMKRVSRSASVVIVFSERLHHEVLSQLGPPIFQLRSAAGQTPPGGWAAALDDASGRHVVTFTPTEPYDNYATYVLTIAAGAAGVRDTAGRPLAVGGLVGSNFETADTIGPEIIGTTPELTRPVPVAGVIRLDFNEAIIASDEDLASAVELEWERAETSGLAEWQSLPASASLTAQGYSLTITPAPGLVLVGDTLRRRLFIAGLTDASGNVMAPPDLPVFRVRDTNVPSITVPYEHFAPGGRLTHGMSYVLQPEFQSASIDCIMETPPFCDIDRVEYFLVDPASPGAQPGFVSRADPFSFAFVAAYAGNGVDPRPFHVWVRAVDTSENASDPTELPFVVLNNRPPTIAAVQVEAIAPVAGAYYAGSTLRATVAGVADADGTQITVSAELWRREPLVRLAAAAGRLVQRPASGVWSDLTPPSFDLSLPIDLAEGAPLHVIARAIDSQGIPVTTESGGFAVADDTTPPVVDGILARRTWPLPAGETPPVFIIGERLQLELSARDVETGVMTVGVTVDRLDIFPAPLVATRVPGSATVFRTAEITVPAAAFTEETAVTAFVVANDYGGNAAQSTLELRLAPAADHDAPVVEWMTPWEGAAWPASHTSPIDPEHGTALLLRARASDTVDNGAGGSLPGAIARVEFRAPIRNSTGEIVPGEWVEGAELAPDDDLSRGEYECVVHVPNGIPAGASLPFDVRVNDTGIGSTTATVHLTSRAARRVYERVELAVLPSDSMVAPGGDPNGPIFLLDGAILSVYPTDDAQPRLVSSLYLYAGGDATAPNTIHATTLTAPRATSYNATTLFYPLALQIDEALGVGAACAVDVSGRGLLGNTGTHSAALPGETASGSFAGGSHGGSGWFGSPADIGGWDRIDLTPAGSVYDSLRSPHLPGGGGTSDLAGVGGGRGGGVIQLLADGATVRIEGDVRADGERAASGGGGAGGTVLLRARRIEGRGNISASGGDGSTSGRAGGGGGGRLAVHFREAGPGTDLAAKVVAIGGRDSSNPAYASRRAGAGTVYLEPLDPETGAGNGIGRLLIGNALHHPAATTTLPALGEGTLVEVDAAARSLVVEAPEAVGECVGDWLVATDESGIELAVLRITSQSVVDQQEGSLRRLLLGVDADEQQLATLLASSPVTITGRTRLATLEGTGAARIVATDDLAVGDAAEASPPLNERSRLTLAHGARALLRGEKPQITLVSEPPTGSHVRAGSAIEVQWTISDPIGVSSLAESWSLAGDATTLLTEATGVTNADAPRRLEVGAAAPGPARFALAATDIAGRSTAAEVSWTVLPNAVPAGTVALAPGTSVPLTAGFSAVVVVHAEDAEGLASVRLIVAGPAASSEMSQPVSGLAGDVSFVVTALPTATGDQPLVVQAVVTDSVGATVTTAPLEIALARNTPPTATLSFAPGTPAAVLPGGTFVVAVDASDAEGLAEIVLHVIGPAGPRTQAFALSGRSAHQQAVVTIDLEAQAGETVAIQAEVHDLYGPAVAWSSSLHMSVLGDTEPPAVQLALAPESEGDIYTAGDVVVVTATAVDNVSASVLVLTLGGATLATAPSPLVHTWTAPPVATTTSFMLAVRATDGAGNQAVVNRTLVVQPLINPDAPVVRFTCPSAAPILPFGYDGLVVAAAATDDTGVALVEFFIGSDTAPFATVAPPSGTRQQFAASAQAPALPASGEAAEVMIRARARDAANNVGETFVVVHLVDAVTLDPGGANDWSALTNRIAVLRNGTLTVDEPRELGGLIVLRGASITHSTSTPSTPRAVRITTTGPLYVECGGSIDVTGRGYGAGVTYAGEVLPGSQSGGSHLGYGGLRGAPLGSTFGSVYRPSEAGGGGRPGWNSTAGGGVIRAIVGGTLVVDGAIRANGSDWDNSNEQGAGGSVWVTAGEVSGGGVIEARGGEGGGYRAGGGGAVAVKHGAGSVVPVILVRGGQDPYGSQATEKGGSGTIYLVGPGATHGELVVDNGGIDGQATELPSLGGGVMQSGSGGAVVVTDRAAVIPAYFMGHWVEVSDGSGALKGTWRVAGIADRTITLEGNGESGEPSVAVGDRWQGVYRFDTVTVKGKAKLDCRDGARLGAVHVEPDSQMLWFDTTPPVIDASKVSLSAHDSAFWVAGEGGSVIDPGGLEETKIRNCRTGDSTVVVVGAGGGFAPLAVIGLGGDEIELVAKSVHHHPITVTARLGVLPENQAEPVLAAGVVESTLDGTGQRRLVGGIGAVTDAELPITIVVRNLGSGIDATATAASDGSFAVPFVGAGGDRILLIATDGHPQGRSATLDLGPLPGNAPPEVDTERITVTYEPERNRGEWIEPAGYVAHFATAALADEDWPLQLSIPYPDGSDAWTWTACDGEGFDWRLWGADLSSGMVLAFTATDSHPAEPRATTVSIGPLPIGNAPPVVDPYWITVLPMGFGFHVIGAADAVRDPDGPITVVLSNARTSWTSSAITTADDGSFYARIEGAQGDEIFLQATDSHLELPLSSENTGLGTLPDPGVTVSEIALDGHAVTRLRGFQAILDGGAAVAQPWLRSRHDQGGDESIGVPLAGLTGAADVMWDERGQWPLVLAGTDLVAFACTADGDCPTPSPGRMTVTSGASLVRGLAHAGYLFLASEGAVTSLHVLSPPFIDADGSVTPACSGAIESLALYAAPGAHVLEVLPGYAGEIAVLTDRADAEVLVVDATDLAAPAVARTIDLAGNGSPAWGVWERGELLVGRSGGVIELWRWEDGTLARWATWQAAGTETRGAARMGDQLWVGLADGRLQQIDLLDPAQPRLVGEVNLGVGVVAVSDSESSLLVATETSLLHVWAWVMPPEIDPDRVAWGHQSGLSWARVEATSYDGIASTIVTWEGVEGRYDGTMSLYTIDQELATPPTVTALDAHGVPGGPYTPVDWQTWGDRLATASEWFPAGAGLPPPSCRSDLATGGDVWTPDGSVPWVATAPRGAAQVELGFGPADRFVGASPPDSTSLAADGPIADLVSLGETLVVLDGGVGVWDLADPGAPLLLSHLDVFGGDPVAAAQIATDSWPPLLVAAAASPLRLVAIDASDSRQPVAGGETTLAPVGGVVVSVARVRDREVAVLLDDGGTPRVVRVDIADPQSPAVVAAAALAPGPPVAALAVHCEETETGCGAASFVAILREGWGVETYALSDLSALHSVPLVGTPRGLRVARDGAGNVHLLVSLGFGHGVASITGLPGPPVVAELHTPGDATGFARHDPGRSGLGEVAVTTPTGIVQLTLPCHMEY